MNKRLIDEQFDPDFPNDHPKNLIPELCRHFYNIGWATGTGGKVHYVVSSIERTTKVPEKCRLSPKVKFNG